MATRWGIAGSGRICHDFVLSITQTLPKEDHSILAVGDGKNFTKQAHEFAAKFNIKKCYESFEELAVDDEIEIVYVGTINPEHHRLVTLFLNHGKHVLCEKPICMNKEDAKELFKLAKDKHLFLMEGVWSIFFPVYQKMKDTIKSGIIGEVKNIQIDFGMKIGDIPRIKCKELGGSAVLDLGIYAIQLILLVLGKPKSVKAVGHLNQYNVDDAVSVVFEYSNGNLGSFITDVRVDLSNEARIYGTKGEIVIGGEGGPFHCPTRIQTPDGLFIFPLPDKGLKFLHGNECGLRYEVIEVRKCLKLGLLECPFMTHENSLVLVELEDEIRKQVAESDKLIN